MVEATLRPLTLDHRLLTFDHLGGPRFVAAERKARLWFGPFVSHGLGPDEAGPSQL